MRLFFQNFELEPMYRGKIEVKYGQKSVMNFLICVHFSSFMTVQNNPGPKIIFDH